jgi:hypothetical protein
VSHEVRTHVRTVNGKKVTVRQHSRDDDGGAPAEQYSESEQRKRHASERRVLAERQRGEARYETGRRPAGGRRSRKKRGPRMAGAKKRGPRMAGAKKRLKKAARLWRRHKVRATMHAGLALGELGAWAVWRGSARAWKASARPRKAIRARLRRGRP